MPEDKTSKETADETEAIDSSGIGEAVGDDATAAEETDEEAEVEGHMFGGVLKPAQQLRPGSIVQNTATVNLDNMYTLYGGLADPLGEITQRPEQR